LFKKAISEQLALPKKLLNIPKVRLLNPNSIGIKKSPKIEKIKILVASESTAEKSISSNEGTSEPKTVCFEQTVKNTDTGALICAPDEIKERYVKVL
jgi:hypothetical protein